MMKVLCVTLLLVSLVLAGDKVTKSWSATAKISSAGSSCAWSSESFCQDHSLSYCLNSTWDGSFTFKDLTPKGKTWMGLGFSLYGSMACPAASIGELTFQLNGMDFADAFIDASSPRWSECQCAAVSDNEFVLKEFSSESQQRFYKYNLQSDNSVKIFSDAIGEGDTVLPCVCSVEVTGYYLDDASDGLPGWAAALITLAVLFFVALIVAGVAAGFYFYKRRVTYNAL
mmetsp:Transcript_32899/g.53386  ORF Transcript_32899/g.53386 Transcript_32899/m.53386 type:complete len:228 (-) Transcript_32899:39-722(-)